MAAPPSATARTLGLLALLALAGTRPTAGAQAEALPEEEEDNSRRDNRRTQANDAGSWELVDFHLEETTHTACTQQRDSILHAALLGADAPTCDEQGRYAARQCSGSTGYCWCVTSRGATIDGTTHGPNEASSVSEDSCVEWRMRIGGATCAEVRAAEVTRGTVGHYAPDCDEEGDFRALQCSGSSGWCWCVDAAGGKLPDTGVGPGGTSAPLTESGCLAQRGEDRVPASPGHWVSVVRDESPWLTTKQVLVVLCALTMAAVCFAGLATQHMRRQRQRQRQPATPHRQLYLRAKTEPGLAEYV
eukprot:COSAG01_NODE_349_length_18469_cov_8.136364_4_plen_303_part_00